MGAGAPVQVTILGAVGIRHEGGGPRLGDRLQRLLAALAIADGAVVSTDRLVDVVWQGDPPGGAEGSLRTYITRLRRALGADRDELIEHHPPGYRLALTPGELDSVQFETELDEALRRLRTADSTDATRLLHSAIGRWRGRALAGFAEEPWARPTAVRLEERLLEAREALVEAALLGGDDERAVADAQRLIEEEPLRERPRTLLMRALYSSGRQAEALRVYAAYRRYLAEETGLEPSPEIAELEGAIARGERSARTPERVLRGYELAERIGEGAYSVVHRAIQPGIERDVAIKIIRSELADDPDFIRRFEFEARTIARIEHPNVVPLIDFWREPGAAYLVMRLLRGGTVEQALRTNGPYSPRRVVELLDDVGSALDAAHRAGVVHRDVRPVNLLLDDNGRTYLADFGISLPSATVDDMPVASPAHAAPELLRREPAGPAADVLSLGITTYQVLAGRVPFADSGDVAETISRQLTDALPSVREWRPELPPAIDDVLARATAKRAADRYATAAAFVAAARSALGVGAGVPGTPAAGHTHGAQTNPYVGLHAFDEPDADRFFGREKLVDELVEAVGRHPLVALVGPSGSGKSSVVRAGLVPALRRGAVPGSAEWFVTTLTPGPDPFAALEAALLRVAVNPPATLWQQLAEPGGMARAVRRVLPDEGSTLLLVVDQFEEIFTQVTDKEVRDRFLDELAATAAAPQPPVRIVATLRADHYDAPLHHRAIAGLVTQGTVTVRPMSPEELERAIVAPARQAGVEVEPALLADLVGGIVDRPTALPLLQFSLTELFERRVSERMSKAVHDEMGGLSGSLAARADRILQEGDTEDAEETRRIFGRLVTLGQGTEDTRRRALRAEFGDDPRTNELLDAFVAARLLATDHEPGWRAPTVEVAHEALLRNWPRLREWFDEDRADLAVLHAVSAATGSWIASGRDEGELARGGRLDAVSQLATRHPDWLNVHEQEWFEASVEADLTEKLAWAVAHEKDRRQNRRLKGLLAAAVVLLLVAFTAGAIAVVSRNDAVESEREARQNADVAVAAVGDAETSEAQAREAEVAAVEAREDADIERLVALSAAALDTDPERATLLALEANRRRDDAVTRGAVQRVVGTEPRLTSVRTLPFNGTLGALLADDTSLAVTWDADAGRLVWFDPADGSEAASLDIPQQLRHQVASGDGRTLTVSDSDEVLTVYRMTGSTVDELLSRRGYPLAMTRDGRALALRDIPSTDTLVVDVDSGAILGRLSWDESDSPVGSVLSDDATEVYTWLVRNDEEVHLQVRDVTSGDEVDRVVIPTGGMVPSSIRPWVSAYAVGDDGRAFTGAEDGTVTIHQRPFARHTPRTVAAHTQGVVTIVPGPDDDMTTFGDDGRVRFWSDDISAARDVVVENVRDVAVDDGIVTIAGEEQMLRLDQNANQLQLARLPAPPQGFFGLDARAGIVIYDHTRRVATRYDGDGAVIGQFRDPPTVVFTTYSHDSEWMLQIADRPDAIEVSIERLDGTDRITADLTPALAAFDILPGQPASIRPLAGGRTVAVVGETSTGSVIAVILDVETGQVLAGPTAVDMVGRLTVLADGRLLVANPFDGTRLLAADLSTVDDVPGIPDGVESHHQNPVTGEVVLAGAEGVVAVLDPDDLTVRVLDDADGFVLNAAFSPDGTQIAAVVPTRGLLFYDVATGQRIGAPVIGAGQAIGGGAGVVWTTDGSGVWFGPSVGPVKVAATIDEWRRLACGLVGRELTAEEWTTFVSDTDEQVPACSQT